MSIIKLKEPWCFNIGDLTEDEIEELYSHFVSEENYHYLWSDADPGSHVGIDWRGTSNYFGNIESFDEYDIEDNVTIYTIEQLRAIIAEHLAKQHVEPESVTKFVVGKWYKWFQKDHGRTQKGKCATLYDNHFEMKPWICHSSEYVESGMFNLRDAESIEIIENLSEIQDLLPDGHEDRAPKPTRSERYLETMKFFEQLKEPERSESIANYDEDYSIYIPKSLESALSSGFCWDNTEQESDYWEHIHGMLLDNTYFQEELLVFGEYKIGDIVVLQVWTDRYPMFKVSKDSTPDKMIDETGAHSTNPSSFRPATPEEVEAYNQGIRNVSDIKPKDYKEAVHCTTQEEWDFVLSKFNPANVSSEKFLDEKEQSTITIKNTNDVCLGCYANVEYDTNQGFTILTFKQWCEKYGHSYEVVPEYVECVESTSHHYKEGKIYTWPDTITEEGKSNKPGILEGCVWKFKPSTKEAYDKQQEKLMMEELLSKAKPTEIKPAKGMHVRCLKENSWSDGKTKVGQVFEIESIDWSGDMWVNNQSFAKERLGRGDFELLPNYKEEPFVAQVGDWVYVLENCAYGSVLNKGEIVKCIKYDTISQQFKEEGCTWLRPKDYRKATQEEIDSVIKTTVTNTQTEWTADNWYVEVSSQEEADAVIDAAAKMYGKPYDKHFAFNDEWKYVSLCCQDKKYSLICRKYIHVGAKPRPIADFIQPEKPTLLETVKKTFFDKPTQQATPDYSYIFAGEVTEGEFNEIKRLCKPQQDELVIYKPKRVIL